MPDERAADDDPVVIEPVTAADYDSVLPFIADYQRFYGVESPDGARNGAFFAPYVERADVGRLLAARRGAELVGYACVAFTTSSVEAEEIVMLNDLYVAPDARGHGAGRALIEATIALARQRGVRRVRWMTALDNRRAQRLYERMGAARSSWFEYEVSVVDAP